MQAAEREDGRRYAAWFRINFSRCIFCGLCTEACPTLALQTTAEYELATRELLQVVCEKDELLIDGCGKNTEYNFYRLAGIGVVAPRGGNPGETPPEDIRSNMP
jgi:NADH-quinone oxidoreductase subunit I